METSKEHANVIRKIARELLSYFGVEDAEITIREGANQAFLADVIKETPQILIGEKGQTLTELQHVLRVIARRELGPDIAVSLDINDYQKNKERYIREVAREVAEEVALLKRAKELPPMTSAERRIAHMEISLREDVVSESTGSGWDRKVIVRPKD